MKLIFLIFPLLVLLTSCNHHKDDKDEVLVCTNGQVKIETTEDSGVKNFGLLSSTHSQSLDVNQQRERYIITFKKGTTSNVARRILGLSFERYIDNLDLAFAKIYHSDSFILTLLQNKNVLAVERDDFMYINSYLDDLLGNDDNNSTAPEEDEKETGAREEQRRGTQPIPEGVERVGAVEAWSHAKYRGRSVKVAVLDTGIDFNHEDLKVIDGHNFTDSGNGESDYMDVDGHGTHVGGTICALDNDYGVVGVAPECQLYSYKVLGDDGIGNDSWIISGISKSISDGMDIINLSLGREGDSTKAFERALRSAEDNGVVVVASGGNNGDDTNTKNYPAKSNYTLAVGALDQYNQRTSWSHYSNIIDISAPGLSIKSTFPDQQYKSLSGTSMAAPHVTGVAALIKEIYPAMSAIQIKEHLKCHSKDIGENGYDIETGFGIVDAYSSVLSSDCNKRMEGNWEYEVTSFDVNKVDDGYKSGVAIKVGLEPRQSNISFELSLYDSSGVILEKKTLKTDDNGQVIAFIEDNKCLKGEFKFLISNFTINNTSLNVSGVKSRTIKL